MDFTKFEEANQPDPEIQAAKDKLNELTKKITQTGDFGLIIKLQDEITDFKEKIQKEFPEDYDKYRAYHILGGSGLKSNQGPFDFEGEFSVINFVNNLEAKITA